MIICPRCQMQNIDNSYQCCRCGFSLIQGRQTRSGSYNTRNFGNQFSFSNQHSISNSQYDELRDEIDE